MEETKAKLIVCLFMIMFSLVSNLVSNPLKLRILVFATFMALF